MSDTSPSNPTPGKIEVTDPQGRKIVLKVMDPADMLDFMEAAGPTVSTNIGWVRLAMTVCSVTSIDGVPVPMAKTKEQVRQLARKLGNDGYAAAYGALFGEPDKADGESESEPKPTIEETAKN